MANSTADKQKVFKGILIAWVLSALFIGVGYWLSKSYNLGSNFSSQEILSLTLIPPGLSLAAGIGWAARTRHFSQNIDGSAPEPGTPLDITLRYIQNTSEQVLLFFLMAICLWGAAPLFAHTILPVLGLWFLVARILFWVGYRRSPISRAIGFASTFHPTLLFLAIGSIAFLVHS